jgi:hypothetical protein
MGVVNFLKPKTAKGNIRQRERDLMAKLEKLMEAKDEATFREGLEKEFGIRPGDPRYEKAMNAWHEAE